jgi:uncharacterized protein YbaR (Trm112 family)
MEYKSQKVLCQNCRNEFVIEPDDFGFYEKIKVPPPTWCPECRMKRRMVFRNERRLFRQTDCLTGEKILSIFPAESGHQIMQERDWWSQEKWHPLSYGKEFDPSRPFLAQLLGLYQEVPKYNTAATRMVNSDYSGNASNLRNCYLLFNSNFTEDSAYGNGVDYSKNCYDISHIQKSERCYESFWLTNCYDTHFSVQCDDCVSVWFSKNCRGCTSCFGCVNLINKSYCFFNEELGKEEYERRFKALGLDKWSELGKSWKKAKNFWLRFPNKFMQGVKNTNVSGEYITHSKNVQKSYLIRECKDLKYVQYSQVPSSYDCMDSTLIGCQSELFYETSVCGWGGANFRFCSECWDGGREFEYCFFCGRSAANLFGCVGIMRQQYCVLNKQYTKEEYQNLVVRIKKHMEEMPYVDRKGRVYKYGEFFPPEFSPFTYNQTIVTEHFPSSQETAEKFGMRWQEPHSSEYEITMKVEELPDSIKDANEKITNEVIQCANCKRAYRIILPELKFLSQAGIPLPRTCVDCRHTDRISQRNKSKIYPRECMCKGEKSENDLYQNSVEHFHGEEKCPEAFETSYAPERPEIVYCERCYQMEVY